MNPIISYLIHEQQISVIDSLHKSSNLILAIIVFSVLFTAKDLSSGYIKNIYTFSNKLCYIFSKVIYFFIFSLIYVIGEFLIDLLLNLLVGVGVIYNLENGPFPAGAFFLSAFTEVLNGTAISTVCCFLCVLLKKEYIVLVIALLYLFVISGAIYIAIDNLVGGDFSIKTYTIFNFYPKVDYDKLFWSTIMPGVIVPVCYILVFGFFSWLILKKRNV